MKEFLYMIVGWIAKIHSYLMRFNDSYEYNFSDKELHFIVIGLLGMAFVFIVYPVFKWLAKHNHVMVIAWIYVFTLILVIILVTIISLTAAQRSEKGKTNVVQGGVNNSVSMVDRVISFPARVVENGLSSMGNLTRLKKTNV